MFIIFYNFVLYIYPLVKKVELMEGESAELQLYPEEMREIVNGYMKRKSIEEFKKTTASQMIKEFNYLEEAKGRDKLLTRHNHNEDYDRYTDIRPFEHNRVVTSQSIDFYLNASIVKSVVDNHIFGIFGQAPTYISIPSFWEAIYEYNVKAIYMLCHLRGADRYWPTSAQKLTLPLPLVITNNGETQEQKQLVKTKLILDGKHGKRQVEHIYWSGWGDMRKPTKQNDELFKGLIEDSLARVSRNELFFVHCMAGVGRTGTFGSVLEAVRCGRATGQVSIFQVVHCLRNMRLYSVQMEEQYTYIYEQTAALLS